MAKYGVEFNRAAASATLAMGVAQSTATPRRLKIYDFIMGSEAAPADNTNLWTIDRVTAQGSFAGGTGVTPSPLDLADAVSLFDAVEGTITTNPTIGARALSVPVNQRSTFRWAAVPGSEIVTPATDNLGIAVQTPVAIGNVAVTAWLGIEEQ